MTKQYYYDDKITIRNMQIKDAKVIYDTYMSYGWHPSMETYTNYYQEQEEEKGWFLSRNMKGILLVFVLLL